MTSGYQPSLVRRLRWSKIGSTMSRYARLCSFESCVELLRIPMRRLNSLAVITSPSMSASKIVISSSIDTVAVCNSASLLAGASAFRRLLGMSAAPIALSLKHATAPFRNAANRMGFAQTRATSEKLSWSKAKFSGRNLSAAFGSLCVQVEQVS